MINNLMIMQLIVNVQNRYKADRENDGCLFTSNVYNRQILLELLVDLIIASMSRILMKF